MIERHVAGMDVERFRMDVKTVDAVERRCKESVKRLYASCLKRNNYVREFSRELSNSILHPGAILEAECLLCTQK
jgi:hypothetical protein